MSERLARMAALVLVLTLIGGRAAGEEANPVRRLTLMARADCPELGLDAVDARLTDWIKSRLEEECRQAAELINHGGGLERESVFELTLDVEVFRPSEQTVSLLCRSYSHSGGAHGALALESRHFNASDGTELEPGDVFRNPELAVRLLAEKAEEGIREYLGQNGEGNEPSVSDGNIPAVDMDWLRDGTAPNWDNYRTLSLVSEGVRVWFQPYQALPYAYGTPNFLVRLKDLEDAGPSREVWPTRPGADGDRGKSAEGDLP